MVQLYNDFILYTNQIANFDKAFELTKMLINSIEPEHLIGYNFGRYTDEGEDHRAHISVRLDLDNDELISNVTEKLDEMRANGDIDDFTYNSPLIPLFREYSINHKLAHEGSTKCAFRFYERKNQDPQEFQEFTDNIVGFLREFTPLWLKHSGFTFNGVDTIAESESNLVNDLAEQCGCIFVSINQNEITNMYDFSERSIHIFLNCLGIPINQDRTLGNELARRFGYNNYIHFLRDLRL